MNKLLISFIVIAVAGLQLSCNVQNRGLPKIRNIFHISGDFPWDFIAVGPGNNRLYVSHGSQVNILNLNTGDSVGLIPGTKGVHGIAFDKTLKKGYTSNGELNNVTVFHLETNKVLGQIATGENPDVIIYEPFSKKILVFNGSSNDISVIDPVKDTVVTTIAIGGKPEGAVSDGAGKIYVNIEDKNEIAVISMLDYSILNHWPIAPGEAGTGLAIDTATKRLFAACDDNNMLIVMDAVNGKVISQFPIGQVCDGVVFDNGTKTIYTSNGDGTMTVIKEKSAASYELVGNVTTKLGAKTIDIDQSTHTLYLPTIEAIVAKGKKTGAVPGSFQVLVIQ